MKILFRKSLAEENEAEVASKYFSVVEHRTQCYNELVIPRYAALPYYKELERDLSNHGCELINTHWMHKWIADFKYYKTVHNFTPETWTDDNFYQCEDDGPFIVKGKTNSRKFQWNTQMFAKNKKEAIRSE